MSDNSDHEFELPPLPSTLSGLIFSLLGVV